VILLGSWLGDSPSLSTVRQDGCGTKWRKVWLSRQKSRQIKGNQAPAQEIFSETVGGNTDWWKLEIVPSEEFCLNLAPLYGADGAAGHPYLMRGLC
jgi:hypothetical protein